MNQNRRIQGAAAALGLLAQACAGNPSPPSGNSASTNLNNTIQNQAQLAATAAGARVTFHQADYYSLLSPKLETSCAGDARIYYDPIALQMPSYPDGYPGYTSTAGVTGPAQMPFNALDTTQTVRPNFIKNVSVDMTDSNAPVSTNLALACSYGSGPTVPPVSNCATFDYGAIGGIPTTMGGTLLLIGGINNTNYAGINSSIASDSYAVSCGPVANQSSIIPPIGVNSCASSMFALGVNTLPGSVASSGPNPLAPGLVSAPTGPISTWANLTSGANYVGPAGVAGAAAGYDTDLQRVLLFGGAAPLASGGSFGAGASTFDTWSYDLRGQKWQQVNPTVSISNAILSLLDTDSASGTTYPLAKAVGARALMGYTTINGVAAGLMSTDGSVNGTPVNGSLSDSDRILIVGGIGTGGVLDDAHRLNPTFGPDLVDTLGYTSAVTGTVDTFNGTRVQQWVDSYFIQLLSNSFAPNPLAYSASSNGYAAYRPDFPPVGQGPTGGSYSFSFGLVGLRHNTLTGNGGKVGVGYGLAMGGFDSGLSANTGASANCPGTNQLLCGGNMYRLEKRAGYSGESQVANVIGIPNILESSGLQLTPNIWTAVSEDGTTSPSGKVPWYGGGVTLQGFNKAQNDVIYFGGADCARYLTDSTAVCNFSTAPNPGRYYRLTDDPKSVSTLDPTANVYTVAGTSPPLAGMAAARGMDAAGNVIIVAWGGISNPAIAGDDTIYYLYNAGNLASPQPTWVQFTPQGVKPSPYGNAQLVFSHVTRKFYLFGGYNPSDSFTSGDTWELDVSPGTDPKGACTTAGSCVFSWKQLNTNGLTCYPNCPQARRSHRMIEVNYYNRNPAGEPVCTDPTQPCSFGIFMEGGTSDGLSYLPDRWMFDPTANGGVGHWQRVDSMPPRTLASMSSVDYVVPTKNGKVHRAVLFGGETSLHSPAMAAPSGNPVTGYVKQYFVPPTLGDTWMYDYDNNSWNRVELLGKGYPSSAIGGNGLDSQIPSITQYDPGQTYCADNACPAGTNRNLAVNTPPALSGSIMVVRTLAAKTNGATGPVATLPVPEVYLLGARRKSGAFLPFDTVYKFCSGTVGERPYNTLNNGNSNADIAGQQIADSPNDQLDDAACDAYDPVTNLNSPGPVAGYVGRWLLKTPGTDGSMTPSNTSSFLGAGTYDPFNDRLVVVGGLKASLVSPASTAITDSAHVGASADVYEYTFPSSSNPAGAPGSTGTVTNNGWWRYVRSCDNYPAPTPRYGHSLGYDTLNQQLVMVGGYDTNGVALTQTQTYYDGRTYQMPEVWVGKRIDQNAPANTIAGVPVAITTAPCYYWSQITVFGNSLDIAAQVPPETGLAHAASVYIPAAGYNTGFYSMFDSACENEGPIAISDPTVNKLLAGGAYFDIDRTALGPNENLILNITYIPLGTQNQRPDTQKFQQSESAIFKVHLMKTGLSGDSIRQMFQPRYLSFSDSQQFPEVAQSISILAPPTGQIRQEQILIPLSIDPSIDRIRIERYSGSGILIEATLMRMGAR